MTFTERLRQLWQSITGRHRPPPSEPMAGHPIPHSDEVEMVPDDEATPDDPPLR